MFSVQLRFPDATIFQFSSSTFRRQPHLASISSHVSLSSSSSWRRATASDAHTETYESLERRWDSLGFNPVKTDYVYVMKSSEDGSFSNGSLRHAERRVEYGESGFVVSQQLYSALANIQMGLTEDKMGWTRVLN
ncbi:Branched-chain amino acid aminotransferase 5 [Hibiscus syriacus]|uniref:Branched-chain amino acid aminotransferase 5 n=1 Tax=Hibiscus syriacus TaxID=106335 RepID=A0A6A2ZV49_HIBSY|nr:Branched-chain amino acid aminotransferase 5 [Hibiscus syriacus]